MRSDYAMKSRGVVVVVVIYIKFVAANRLWLANLASIRFDYSGWHPLESLIFLTHSWLGHSASLSG